MSTQDQARQAAGGERSGSISAPQPAAHAGPASVAASQFRAAAAPGGHAAMHGHQQPSTAAMEMVSRGFSPQQMVMIVSPPAMASQGLATSAGSAIAMGYQPTAGSMAYPAQFAPYAMQGLPPGTVFVQPPPHQLYTMGGVAASATAASAAAASAAAVVSSPPAAPSAKFHLDRERARYVMASKQANAVTISNRDRNDDIDIRRMRAFSRLKGHSFTLANRSGKWTLPLGLTTMRKHSTAVRTSFFRKAKALRDSRKMKANLTRKVGFRQYSEGTLTSPTPSASLQVGPSEYGPLPGQLLVHTVDDGTSNWLGINADVPSDADTTTPVKQSTKVRAKKATSGSSGRRPSTAGKAKAAAPMSVPEVPTTDARTRPAAASAAAAAAAAAIAAAAAAAEQPAVVTSSGRRVKKKSLDIGEVPKRSQTKSLSGKRKGKQVAKAKPSPPPQNRGQWSSAAADTDETEDDLDDGFEPPSASASDDDDNEDDEGEDESEDDDWSYAPRQKKRFPTAAVLVSVSDPDNIRCFVTAAKAQNYLKLRNKMIYYQARRNETSLKGWFIFDGADYSRKTGRAITEELLEETDEKARAERAEADAARKERAAASGKKKKDEPPQAPIRTSRRTTAGKRFSGTYVEETEEQAEKAAPSTKRKVAMATAAANKGKGKGRAGKEATTVDSDEGEEGEDEDDADVEEKKTIPPAAASHNRSASSRRPSSSGGRPGSAGRGPPPRCDCGRYFSSQDLVDACRLSHTKGQRKGKSKSKTAAAAAAAAAADDMLTSPKETTGFASHIPEVEAIDAKPQIGFMTSEVGLRQPSLPEAFNYHGVKPTSLFIKTFKSVARDDDRTYTDSVSPSGARQRPTLQALLGSVDPPDCPESVLAMDEYPLVRIGDTFEIGIRLSKKPSKKQNMWQILEPHGHAAFSLCNYDVKVEFESYYYDYCSGIVCLRCQNAPTVCSCTFPNDLISVSTRVPVAHAPEIAGKGSVGSRYTKICCKIPRSRSRGRSNSWNSNLRTITGKAPKVMLIRAIESHATGDGEWEVVSVQQAYCRLIAKNGALDLAYAGGAPRRRSLSSSPGSATTPTRKRKESNRSPSPLWEQMDEGEVFDERSTPQKKRRASSSAASPVGVAPASTPTSSGKRSLLPSSAVAVLKQWLAKHTDNPYPTEYQKKALGQQLGLTHAQVSYWFINARRRLLGPMLRDEAKRKEVFPKQ